MSTLDNDNEFVSVSYAINQNCSQINDIEASLLLNGADIADADIIDISSYTPVYQLHGHYGLNCAVIKQVGALKEKKDAQLKVRIGGFKFYNYDCKLFSCLYLAEHISSLTAVKMIELEFTQKNTSSKGKISNFKDDCIEYIIGVEFVPTEKVELRFPNVVHIGSFVFYGYDPQNREKVKLGSENTYCGDKKIIDMLLQYISHDTVTDHLKFDAH